MKNTMVRWALLLSGSVFALPIAGCESVTELFEKLVGLVSGGTA